MGSLFKKKETKNEAPPGQLSSELFQELCRDGERADLMVGQGQPLEGNAILQSVFKRMIAARTVDEFLMSKVCLSSMIAGIAMNNIELAHGVWTATLPGGASPYFKVGIDGLESGVCDLRDTLIFQATGCFLHACNADLGAATKAVNGIMGPVLEKSTEVLSDSVDGLLSHWKYCLTRIYDDDPAPSNLFGELEACAGRLNLSLPKQAKLALIKPSEWKTDTQVVGSRPTS